MTTAELNAAIAAGKMTITRLPASGPRYTTMTRVGGFRSTLVGYRPDATLIQGSEAWGKKATKQNRRRIK